MKIMTIVGARPQFIKAAVVSSALAQTGRINELIVHTGQHYDDQMSRVFFDELGIPRPAFNLEVGSGSHGAQTGRILESLEQVLLDEKPDLVLIYGDTNSTLAGALAAAKLHITSAHVEAGMRSFNRRMPEEVNRVVADHLTDLHFCATKTAVENLKTEGVTKGVHWVGDVMLDAVNRFSELARGKADFITKGLHSRYAVVTCHRAENTDDPERLAEIVEGLRRISEELPIVFPLHPRTKKALGDTIENLGPRVKTVEPLSYSAMIDLQARASLLLTDSGGVQKEAYFLGVPCVTMRDETEWVETLEGGWNRLAGASASKIIQAALSALENFQEVSSRSLEDFGGGKAAERIAELLASPGENNKTSKISN